MDTEDRGNFVTFQIVRRSLLEFQPIKILAQLYILCLIQFKQEIDEIHVLPTKISLYSTQFLHISTDTSGNEAHTQMSSCSWAQFQEHTSLIL